jgi:very-short-patch-repair endonuclease
VVISFEQSIAFLKPKLASEWHPYKNGELRPSDLLPGSGKKIWWQCHKNKEHEWYISPDHRTRRNSSCPYCSFKRLHPTNSLKALYPKIAYEWDEGKNKKKSNEVPARWSQKSYWICERGHSFVYSVRQRTVNGLNCPYCSKRKASTEYNLLTLNPELGCEWNYSKNVNIMPEQVLPSSNKKVWWRCQFGHEWEAQINNRVKKKGCPYCSHRKLRPEFSFGSKFPGKSSMWHPEKNGTLTPYNVFPKSNKKYWWQCTKNKQHVWQTSPSSIKGCPFCSGKRVSAENSLATLNEKLAKEWHPDRNQLTPLEVTAQSSKKVWWKCELGHEWIAMISNRNKGRGCPHCSSTGTSLVEQIFYNEIRLVFFDAQNLVHQFGGKKYEADIYIPSLNLVIEYDGVLWHSKKEVVERDKRKNEFYRKKGVNVLRIRERDLPRLEDDDILFDYRRETHIDILRKIKAFILLRYNKYLTSEVRIRLEELDKERTINLNFSKASLIRKQSIAILDPELARQWHPVNNGDLTPEMVSPNSSRAIWWQCQKYDHHEWSATPNERSRGDGCPFCSHHRVATETSLAMVSPDIAFEWHSEKNKNVTPKDVLPNSSKRV